jgi:hypothetical protein
VHNKLRPNKRGNKVHPPTLRWDKNENLCEINHKNKDYRKRAPLIDNQNKRLTKAIKMLFCVINSPELYQELNKKLEYKDKTIASQASELEAVKKQIEEKNSIIAQLKQESNASGSQPQTPDKCPGTPQEPQQKAINIKVEEQAKEEQKLPYFLAILKDGTKMETHDGKAFKQFINNPNAFNYPKEEEYVLC